MDSALGQRAKVGTRTFLRASAGMTSSVLDDGNASYTPDVSEVRNSVTTYSHSGLKNMGAQTDAGTTPAVQATRTYDAFGGVQGSTGSWQGPFGTAGAFGYQSPQNGNEQGGLHLLGHRYHDASTGRFLTRDPIGDGSNWYAYCENSPAGNADASGQLALQLAAYVADLIDDIPPHPPGVDVFSNAGSARAMALVFREGWENDGRHKWGGIGTIPATSDYFRQRLSWFEMMVTDGGPWDYKLRGPNYEDFGNWHYGVVAHEFGIGKSVALRAAGYNQSKKGLSRREDGWYGDAPGRDSAYGDDPKDQEWIKKGYDWADRVWGKVH